MAQNSYIDELVGLRGKQKGYLTESYGEQTQDARRKLLNMLGAQGLGAGGSKVMGSYQDFASDRGKGLSGALLGHDVETAKTLAGAKEGELARQQSDLDRALRERLGLEQLNLSREQMAQQQKQFEKSQPKWWDYLLGAGTSAGSMFIPKKISIV